MERRLDRLDLKVNVMLGGLGVILSVLLGGQAALLQRMGELTATVGDLAARVAQIHG
jgi:hypothetical protein